MDTSTLITESIRAAVARAGTQERFAELCGVTQGAVHKWLHGKSKPRADRALILERQTKGRVLASELRPDVFLPQEEHAA